MTHEYLLSKQMELQREAHEVLKNLDILDTLSVYGEPVIVGSLATGLMTWKDIDIEIEKEMDEDKYWDVVKKLFHTPKYKRLNVIDFRRSENPISPKGLHICISDYYYQGKGAWKIDIWFIPPRKKEEKSFHEWLVENLKEEHKIPILEIKQQVVPHPLYKHEIFSVDIYKAVITEGVRNLNGFNSYLKKTNRKLE